MNTEHVDRHLNDILEHELEASGLDEENLLGRVLRVIEVDEVSADRRARRYSPRLAIPLFAAVVIVGLSGIAIAAGTPLLNQLGIFDKPSSPISAEATEQSATLGEAVEMMPKEFGEIGTLDAGSRSVGINEDVRGVQVELVLSRTTTGTVCLTSIYREGDNPKGGGGGCFEQVDGQSFFRSKYRGRDVLYGIVPDEIQAVSIATSAGDDTAIVARNTFFWIAADKSSSFEGWSSSASGTAP
jgi:hypothetical protein